MHLQSEASGRPSTQGHAQDFAVFLCGTISFMDLYSTQPMLPMLEQVFRTTETHVTSTVSAATIGVAITSLLLAAFGQGLHRKRTMVLSMGMLSICTLLTITAHSLNTFIAWRFLQGLLTPGIFILTITYITEEWEPRNVPRVMSGYVAGSVFGGFLGRLVGGIIAADFGWQRVYLILGLLLALGTLTTHLLLVAPRRPRHAPPKHMRFSPMMTSMKEPRLLATFAIGFCMLFAQISIFSYITFYLSVAPFNLSTTQLSYLFSVYLVGLVATLAAGRYLVRIGLRTAMVFSILLTLLSILLTLVHSLPAVIIGLSLCSSGIFITQTCANSFLRDASQSSSRVAAVGLYIFSYYVGGTVGGIVPGIAYAHGQWPACVALTGIVLVAAGLLSYFGWSKRKHGLDPIPLTSDPYF